ncbi:MAG: type II toxin-antitoxin system PemK/MazF family toxin [Gemmatimonadetes bacterium]|nr:type II toxin-antitoxin system PemK/MazF family toxin [Gemmatimonadota bacterium]
MVAPTILRGGVHWVELDKRRPCVVVSSPEVLRVPVWQTHVVPLTSVLQRAGLAGNVLLPAAVTGLPQDSVAVPLGLELVDRAWLGEPVGWLPDPLINAIDDGLRAVLGV